MPSGPAPQVPSASPSPDAGPEPEPTGRRQAACEPSSRSRAATASRRWPRELLGLGVEIYATDGTREHLAGEGIEVASVTGPDPSSARSVGSQVKTFHPAVYAGILARRDDPAHLAQLVEHGIGLIDLVIVNVKPFAPEVGAAVHRIDEALEMVDVGGVALLAAAARNCAAGVVAVCGSDHYPLVEELGSPRGPL